MERLKCRVFYDKEMGDDDTIYLGIDTFENIEERAGKEDKYSMAMEIGKPGFYRPNPTLRNKYVLILKSDVTRTPTMTEYMIMSNALKKAHFKFNKKAGELVHVG